MCIALQYVCDDNPDCPDHFDEDKELCSASKYVFFNNFVLLTIVGFLNSCILQTNLTLASEDIRLIFLYILSLDIDSYKTAV